MTLVEQVFQRVAPSEKLKMFRDSIRLFIQHFVVKGSAKNGIDEAQLKLLKIRSKQADQALNTSAIRF